MATRLFSTEELFVKIMLDMCISAEQLFTLQRVSRIFHDTISISFYLKGKMRLRELTQQEHQQSRLQAHANRANTEQQPSAEQFTLICGITSCAEDDEARGKRLAALAVLQSSQTIDLLSLTHDHDIEIGLRSHEHSLSRAMQGLGQHVHDVEQSWRHIVFTRLSQPLRVKVTITVVSPVWPHCTYYGEVTELNAEHRTPAKIVAVLLRVASRSHEDHLMRAYEAGKDRKANTHDQDRRRDIGPCYSCNGTDDGYYDLSDSSDF